MLPDTKKATATDQVAHGLHHAAAGRTRNPGNRAGGITACSIMG